MALPNSVAGYVAGALAIFAGVLAGSESWAIVLHLVVSPGGTGVTPLAVVSAGWLLWHRRHFIYHCEGDAIAGFLLLLACLLARVVAAQYDVQFVVQFTGLAIVFAVLVALTGAQALSTIVIALGVLAFALPIPGTVIENIAVPLQLIEARAVELIALLLDFDVSRDGTVISVSNTPVGIDLDCSALNLVWPLMIATWTALFSTSATVMARVAFCLISLPIVLLINLLRLVILVLAYGHMAPEVGDVLHVALGWCLVVAIGASPFLLFPPSEVRTSKALSYPTRPMVRVAACAIAICLCSYHLTTHTEEAVHPETDEFATRLHSLPWRIDQWLGARRALPMREAEILGADAVVHRTYRDLKKSEELLLVVAYHRDPLVNKQHSATYCYRARGWLLIERDDNVFDPDPILGARFVFSQGRSVLTVFETIMEQSDGGHMRILLVMEGRRADSLAIAIALRFNTVVETIAMREGSKPDIPERRT